MEIQVWSDYACPFCWIGEARLARAIGESGIETQFEITPRAFELNPNAPGTAAINGLTTIARRYGMPLSVARREFEKIARLGREEGLELKQEETHHTNTFNAHRLMKMGLATGRGDLAAKLNELLFAAFFVDNLNLADRGVLLEIGKKAGLAEEEIRAMLNSNRFAAEVRADEEEAARRGIHGVPFFLFPDGATISGAAPLEDFLAALNGVFLSSGSNGENRQCGTNGCLL